MLEFLLGAIALAFALLGIAAVFALLAAVGAGALLGKSAEWLAGLLIWAKPSGVGREGLLGETGRVVGTFATPGPGLQLEGKVEVRGELWSARLSGSKRPELGAEVRVVEVDHLVLVVECAGGGQPPN